MLRKLFIIYFGTVLMCLGTFTASAQLEEGRSLYYDGKYIQAINTLRPMLKKNPKDGNANYYIGASYFMLGDYAKANAPLKMAKQRGVADAVRMLAEMAVDDYDVDLAEEYFDEWDALLSKNNRKGGERYKKLRTRLVLMRNMLERVEMIQIIDSVQVDADSFFKHYKLSHGAGLLIDGGKYKNIYNIASPGVVYRNANDTEIFWAANDSLGTVSQIYTASILADGSIDHPVDVTAKMDDFNGSSNFPFLMTDGVTLYFANNGENSLGGYDIFMTRKGDDGFLQPQNIGMPYNSPYNDYMLAIDEENGVGWWATDRNAPDGKLTIYTYVLNDVRKNAEGDAANARSLAKVTSIAKTQLPSVDYNAYRRRIEENLNVSDAADQIIDFTFPLGNGLVYTSLQDFKNPEARQLMEQYLAELAQMTKIEHLLELYRQEYSKGNKSMSDKILALERRMLEYPEILKRISNQVIATEINR